MFFILSLFLWLSLLTPDTLGQQSDSIVSWAQKKDRYSEWLKLVNNDIPKYRTLLEGSVFDLTAFVPTNEAFLMFTESTNDLLAAHLLFGSYDADSLLKSENRDSLDQQRPKLRFTKGFDRVTNMSAIYVLDAKILESYKVGNSMVHIVDRVLNPPKSSSPVAPQALEWINYPNLYPKISVKGGVNTFSSFINSTRSIRDFSDCIACTFFVPENIESETSRLIDRNVLLGHIIPNQILFLRSMNNSNLYKTKADSGEFHVELSREVRTDEKLEKSYIYSTTKGSIKNIRLGNTRVRVTRGNIPVSNGVVHIIEKPLIITDMSVLDYINEESQTSLSEFFNLLQQNNNLRPYYSRGDATRPLTLFAFTNEAFRSVRADIDLMNKTTKEELMRLHFVDNSLITSRNANSIKEIPSIATNKKLHFSVAGDKLYVEGDGVKAAAVLQDIACTNGVIHVINKVLGIPSSLMRDKLREDPQLKTTFTVAEKIRSDWLRRLGDKNKNFTFFAPSEAAWKKLSDEDPSSFKQLVDGLYAENAMNILNRHLVENQAISFESLSKMNMVSTVNSELQIEPKALPSGQPKVILKFMQLKSTIVRPDIKAINGYIHEIDTILMQDTDLAVEASAVRGSASLSRISPAIIIISIAAYILKLF